MNITFISASAGSGKTYRITEIIKERLTQGTCRPQGLIATTYTVKAAQELNERIRRRLYDDGRPDLAERTGESVIGTVHGVCGRILARFAFEAGISPQIEQLDETQALTLLGQAVETAIGAQELQHVLALADQLGLTDSQSYESLYKKQVCTIVHIAQVNDFDPASLDTMVRQSIEELIGLMPPEASTNLDDELQAAMESAIKGIEGNGDTTKVTKGYVDYLSGCLRQLAHGPLSWSAWVKLSKTDPGKVSKDAAAPVLAVAAQFESHPRLRGQMREYTALTVSFAQRVWGAYQQMKEERGMLDFADLEQRALHLLRDNAQVREILGQDLDLLVVDEFQDTNPIQLAVFMQLAACAKEVVWVGDVKQAIYGFRNSDPELINAVVAEVRRSGTFAPPLATSYRSVPELVTLANALFTPAFRKSLGLADSEVRLDAHRKSTVPPQPAVEFLVFSSGQTRKTTGAPTSLTIPEYAAAIAQWVRQTLDAAETRFVMDKQTGQVRPVTPRDIAILCRKNDKADKIADALVAQGVPVALSRRGLLATPEARLANACLRRLADPADTLAAAEIVALEGGIEPETWLASRLDYAAGMAGNGAASRNDKWGVEGSFVHPALCAIEKARAGLTVFSPCEALDAAIAAAGVNDMVTAWGPTVRRAAQRRANIEALRALAIQYEHDCATTHVPATVAGFMFWCDDIRESNEDWQGMDDQADAVYAGTYHSAKGLEWPVVICADLNADARSAAWGIAAKTDDPHCQFNIGHPLANRNLHWWLWPFGQQETGIPVAAAVDASAMGLAAQKAAENEELRLLYMGLTRARDQLVLALNEGGATTWLDALNAPWLLPQNADHKLVLPDKTEIPSRTTRILYQPVDVQPAQADTDYRWFSTPVARTEKLPARLTPSLQAPLGATPIEDTIDFGARLPFTGSPDESVLGNALHGILAAEFVNPGHADRKAMAERVLSAHGLNACVKADDALAMVDRFRTQVMQQFNPKSILVEVPFESVNPAGQRIHGFIDLLLETKNGWVVIDHKSFPGPRGKWAEKALSYSGQLACYRQALAAAGRTCCGTWVHFTVGGGMVGVGSG